MDGRQDSLLIRQLRPKTEGLPGEAVRAWAPAKINLNLVVGPVRPDGYHELDSYVVKVTLYDRIDLRRRDDGRIRLQCRGFDCGPTEGNLAWRAAQLLATGRNVGGVDIELVKQVPPGGGLGGGSSDAAVVLSALDGLWGLRLAPRQMADAAAALGSDVPLFLGPAACRMTGRGEKIQPVNVQDFWAVLVLPELHCETGRVYRAFDSFARSEARQLPPELLTGEPPSRWRHLLRNQLAAAAETVCDGLADLRRRLAAAVDAPVCMTGSGSAFFILCDDLPEARAVHAAVPPDLPVNCLIVRRNPW